MRTNVAYLVSLQKQEMEKVFPGEITFCLDVEKPFAASTGAAEL